MKIYIPKTFRIDSRPEDENGNIAFVPVPLSDAEVGEAVLRQVAAVWPGADVELFDVDRTSDDENYLVEFRFVPNEPTAILCGFCAAESGTDSHTAECERSRV